jgi:hypothetical protein
LEMNGNAALYVDLQLLSTETELRVPTTP